MANGTQMGAGIYFGSFIMFGLLISAFVISIVAMTRADDAQDRLDVLEAARTTKGGGGGGGGDKEAGE